MYIQVYWFSGGKPMMILLARWRPSHTAEPWQEQKAAAKKLLKRSWEKKGIRSFSVIFMLSYYAWLDVILDICFTCLVVFI
jgi:RecB family exonuclease